MNKDRLEINAGGLINGLRNKKDGFTYFGTQVKMNDEVMIDYKINTENLFIGKIDNENNGGENANGQGIFVFLIYYKSGKYYIRACRDKKDSVSFSLLKVKIDFGYVRIYLNSFKIRK